MISRTTPVNAPAVCRMCYVHPDKIDALMEGILLSVLSDISPRRVSSNPHDLDSAEAAVLKPLQARLDASKTPLPQLWEVGFNG
jgi:DNA topoisomerase I